MILFDNLNRITVFSFVLTFFFTLSNSSIAETILTCKSSRGLERGLVIDISSNVLISETMDQDTVNFPIKISRKSSRTVEATYRVLEFAKHAIDYNPELRDIFESFVNLPYQVDKRYRKEAIQLFNNWTGRIIVNRETGDAKFTFDALTWSNNSRKPPGAKNVPASTEYFKCKKGKVRF